MRKVLNRLYGGALAGACLAMAAIAVLVLIQVVGRMLDRVLVFLGMARLGIAVPSLAEIGGFLFVAAAFLALAATLRAGVHIRVTFLVRLLGPVGNGLLTILVLAGALALACFATWHAGAQALDSRAFGTVSYGLVRIPLWVPQGVMTLGLAVFAIALLDELVTAVRGGEPTFRAVERAREKEQTR